MWVRFPSEGEKERGIEGRKERGRELEKEGGREREPIFLEFAKTLVAPGSALGKLPPTPLDSARSCFMSFQVPQRHLN